MIKNILLIGLTFFKVFASAQNFSVTYGFPEVMPTSGQIDPSNTPSVVGIQFNSFMATGCSLNPNASGRFSFINWPVGASNADNNYGNYTSVLSATAFYEVTLLVKPDYTLNLTHLSFDVRRSSTGIRTYCVRSSLDNFTNNLPVVTGTNTNLSVIPINTIFWNFDSISTSNDQRGSQVNFNELYTSLTGAISFRFFAWNAESSGGSFSIDNVNFTGSVYDSLTLSSILNISKETRSSLKVYPNPCFDTYITLKSDFAFSKIELLNINGGFIFSEEISPPKQEFVLNTVAFKSGNYFIRIIGEKIIEQKRLTLRKD